KDSANDAATIEEPTTKGVRASPAARRAARERDLDLSEISGSGPNGRVYLSDVVNFEAEVPDTADMAANGSGTSAPEAPDVAGYRREALSRVRKIGADRTQRSFAEVPHFYLRRDLDSGGLVELREKLKSRLDPAPSLNDLISFAVCRTLEHHPHLNARYDSGDLVISEAVNLGVAAATDRGLVVPVIKSADSLRLHDLAVRTRELFEKAREGKLAREDLTGGTFTISNLGMMGIDSFDAIINQPEAAILAIGRLRTAPEWSGGEWLPRQVISATLSVDHRVADGADGARFLADLQAALADWELLL
ncbi:MAG: dihydrolipoamide acetyltransferase family protein, partial [Rubrobacteraceae bacterium]